MKIARFRLPASLAAPHPALRFVVTIPARNEAESIEATLDAISAQRDDTGNPLPYGAVETLLFANGCDDATANRARAWAERAPQTIVHVVEGDLPAGRAHVGTARAALMDAAGERLASVRRPFGTIATTDADSIVGTRWVAETERALLTADAVGGRIFVAPAVMRTLPPALACALADEERYRFAIARLEALLDPQSHDPWPRHGQQFGASLAVRAGVYAAVGGLPPEPFLEDVAFYGALLRHDARFCHSLRVRVATSPRVDPRASGGFGTHLTLLGALGARGSAQHVEDPTLTNARIRARATLRRWWLRGSFAADAADRRFACETFATNEREVRSRLSATATFGAAFATLEAAAEERGAFRVAPMTVGAATARLEAAYAGGEPPRASERSSAARPARKSAASGAG